MKLWELLLNGEERLKEANLAEYMNDAYTLLEYVLQIDRNYYLMHKVDEIEKDKEVAFNALIEERAKRIPVQYLTHSAPFMGMDFYVNENVLIPRFDTEVLVELCLKNIPKEKPVRVLDMCTGSGCIAISLAKMFQGEIAVFAADVSEEALYVADKNCSRLGAFVETILSDLFENITDTYDVIVSNPPYIRTKEIKTLMPEVKEHEPMLALDGTEDGLKYYRDITSQAPKFLNKGGLLFFEIGHDQGEEVKELMLKAGFTDVEIVKDLAGLDRVIWGRQGD